MEKTRLSPAQITPGMKLAQPIANAAGVTLMPAGVRLTPMFIARIKKWNIAAVDVFVENGAAGETDGDAAGKPPPARSAAGTRAGGTGLVSASQEQYARAVAAEVAKVFANMRENPLMMKLRSAVIRRLVAKGANSPLGVLRRGPPDEAPLPLPLPPADGEAG